MYDCDLVILYFIGKVSCFLKSYWHASFEDANFSGCLAFTFPCIKNTFPNYNQPDATFLDLFISTYALHVSGGSSAHHQEHRTVHTTSVIVNK